MIGELHIRGLALIDDATLSLCEGLTVLTGETGAGKTALLSAIKLIVGGRADAGAVRDGAREALVEATFRSTPQLRDALAQLGFDDDGPEVVVKRRVNAEGRSRCHINGGLASVRNLAQTAGQLVELHGQHEHQRLLAPATHVGYLDRWAQRAIDAPLRAYRDALARHREAQQRLRAAEEASRASGFQLEQARYVCEQVGAVNPAEGEYEQLEQRVPVLRNGEALCLGAASALAALRDEGGVADLLARASLELARLGGTDARLDAIAARLDAQAADLEDICLELRAYRDDIEFDPAALQEALDRLGQLDGLVRRFGPTYESVLELWASSRALLEGAEGADDLLQRLALEAQQARGALEQAAQTLEQVRTDAAARFCAALADDVAQLAMAGARFEMREEALDIDAWNEQGSKRYELLYAPAAGVAPRALSKIASGGELSRVMLSLECLIMQADEGISRARGTAAGLEHERKTLVFDEVDAGIGGTTAHAVAQRIAQLASRHQVVVVTHLAQIAALAHRHLLVQKTVDEKDGAATTTIGAIEGADRVHEVARMLSGSDDEAALEHAESLLKAAAR